VNFPESPRWTTHEEGILVKVPEPTGERPLAWTAILAETPVFAGTQEIGPLVLVLGAEDIFHGIVIRDSTQAKDVMIPAAHVTGITNARIDTDMTVEEVRHLPPYGQSEY
jgi:hypothetical protein